MSEEKDKHTDIEKLSDAQTNTFFNTRLGIVDADLTKNVFSPANQIRSNIIIPRSQTHEVDDGHFDGEIISFETSPPSPALTPAEGDLYWNTTDKTLNIKTDTDTVIQVGQEVVVRVINKTGGELSNGEVVYISGANVAADRPTAMEADASTWEDSQMTLGVMTSTVANNGEGFVTVVGLVREVDTSGMTAGDRIYLSETTGAFTTTRPISPAYIIEIGVVVKVDASEGIIFVHPQNNDDFGFHNKSFIEGFDLTVSEAGGTVTASLQRTGGGNLTMRFSTGPFTTLVTAPMTKALVPGTATVPKSNFLYVLESDQTQMTLSNTSYPASNVEHIKIAEVVLLTAAITALDDPLANQNVNDHAFEHMSHVNEWVRAQAATYEPPGIDGNSSTGDDYFEIETVPDKVYFRSTAGTVRQMHLQTYPIKDTGSINGGGSDTMYVVNDPDAAYARITDLIAGITKISDGTAWGNNKHIGLFCFGVISKTGEGQQIMCLLPDGQYNSQLGAENDISGFTNTAIPDIFRGTGFPICKIVCKKVGSTIEYESTKDLRTPTALLGGGTGGVAIVDFPDNTHNIFNATDPTKRILHDASAIGAGTDRTIIMPDNDVILDILALNTISSFVQKIHYNPGNLLHVAVQYGALQQNIDGTSTGDTGSVFLYGGWQPPEWLMRYCVINSKTLTLTTITLNWNNAVNGDYITQAICYWVDHNAASNSAIFTDATDLGNGSTGFRNDVMNVTDTVAAYGDMFYLRTDCIQGTGNSCRLFSIEATYTIT